MSKILKMLPQLKDLSSQEQELVYKAPVLVCILIAGADGNIDRDEIGAAIKQANKKQRNAGEAMMELYHEISEDFEDKLKVLEQNYPIETTQRNPLLVEELSTLNQLWDKLDATFSISYYQSLLDLALSVAKSSGGFFGLKSIGESEAKFVKLPMIKNPA